MKLLFVCLICIASILPSCGQSKMDAYSEMQLSNIDEKQEEQKDTNAQNVLTLASSSDDEGTISQEESWELQAYIKEPFYYGDIIGSALGQSQGINQGYNMNSSHGLSSNHGTSQGYSTNQSSGISQGASSSTGYNQSESTSFNASESQNASTSQNVGRNSSVGFSQNESSSISNSATLSRSQGSTLTRGLSDSYSTGITNSISQNQSLGSSFGRSVGGSYSESLSETLGQSASAGNSRSINVSILGQGYNASTNINLGSQDSTTRGSSYGSTWGSNIGYSASSSVGSSQSVNSGHSMGSSVSNSVNVGTSSSMGSSMGRTSGYGLTNSSGVSESYGVTNGQSISQGWGTSTSNGSSQTFSNNVGMNQSYGSGYNTGMSNSVGASTSASQGMNWGNNYGTNQSINASNGIGSNQSISSGDSVSVNQSVNQSEGWGESVSYSQGESYNVNHSINTSQNESVSNSQTLGQTLGQSVSQSVTENASTGYGENYGRTEGVSTGNSYTTSNGTSNSISNGTTGTATIGSSSSMGFGPSIGYNKSYQWLDQGVKDLLELMEYQNERIKKALRGEGAFYTYMYIACPTLDALSTAQAVAKSTWQNENAMTQPLQVLDLTETEQRHLLYHFEAFSADVTKEDVFGLRQYKYCTVLLPEEFVAYSHLPRVSEGGIFAEIQDIPKFAVPSMMRGEIYMGTILSAERFTFNNGYRTQFDYRIAEDELMHGFLTGASRSGKTVAGMRFIAELSQVKRKQTGKRLRIVVMDPKHDWRTLARFVEPERFNFYSLGNPNFRPVKINPWKIPKGVWPQAWIDGIIDIYCRAYGLLELGKQMLGGIVYALYAEAGIFTASDKDDWDKTNEIRDLSSNVCFEKIYRRMYEEKARLENPNNPAGRAGNDTRDAYRRLLDRLACFDRKYSIENRLFGTSEGMSIDELIGNDDVTVLESEGLENTFKNFIFGAITSGFYKFAKAHEGGYLAPDQYETVLVIEEANEVLIGNDAAKSGGKDMSLSGPSEFEQILDQSAGYGLFIFAITQKIADMPSSIIANSGLIFSGRLRRPDDVNVVVRALGREERIDDRDLVKWMPLIQTGWFICQSTRTTNYKDSQPVLVEIASLNINPPSNSELDDILLQKQADLLLEDKVS